VDPLLRGGFWLRRSRSRPELVASVEESARGGPEQLIKMATRSRPANCDTVASNIEAEPARSDRRVSGLPRCA
jgi:hypothetical protein